MTTTRIIKEFIWKNEYEFRIYDTTFMVYRISKKARWGLVWEWWYDYKWDKDLLEKAMNGFIASRLARDTAKEDARKKRLEDNKKRRDDLAASIKVWDLFHRSWGYDMTFNDFYQVTNVKGKKIYVRPISSKITDEYRWYSGEEMPVKDSFTWDEKGYILSPHGWIKVCEYDHAYKSEWDRSYYFNRED